MQARFIKTVAGAGIMLACAAAGYVFAQANAPQTAPRVIETELQTIDLGEHFEAMRGKRMLLAHAVIEPGAKGSLHTHKGWPEVVYILKGVLTEHQGGIATDYGPGESFISNTDLRISHQIENRGSVPVEAVLVEIPNR
jgi:mannose-6-phosphate isomerase-like protein (cupin superfamily)